MIWVMFEDASGNLLRSYCSSDCCYWYWCLCWCCCCYCILWTWNSESKCVGDNAFKTPQLPPQFLETCRKEFFWLARHKITIACKLVFHSLLFLKSLPLQVSGCQPNLVKEYARQSVFSLRANYLNKKTDDSSIMILLFFCHTSLSAAHSRFHESSSLKKLLLTRHADIYNVDGLSFDILEFASSRAVSGYLQQKSGPYRLTEDEHSKFEQDFREQLLKTCAKLEEFWAGSVSAF